MKSAPLPFNTYPVIGALTPSLLTIMHPEFSAHSFDDYRTEHVHGLARVMSTPRDGHRLDLLVITVWHQGRGHGGRFIDACTAAYAWVRVYEIENDTLRAMLARRGFVPFDCFEHGGTTSGMQWRRRQL